MIKVDLGGKVAIVTGGGRGIGRAIAASLAEAGADVCVTARTKSQLEEVVEAVEKLGRKALAVAGDATDPDTAALVVERTQKKLGGLHILANNAGMELAKPLTESTPEEFDRIMAVNVKSMMLFTKAAGEVMIAQKFGRIVNTASTGAFIAGPNQSLYHASKAACAHFTRAMAIEWARYNITVNAIAPGWVNTELISHLTSNEEMLKKYLKGVPMRRLAEPEEIGPLAAFLCSDLAAYMTGSVVVIDGGLMIP